MKLYLLIAVCTFFACEAYAACYTEFLIDPGTQCEEGSIWEDKDECMKCYCRAAGWSKECCDLNPYPTIEDTKRCELVQEGCQWRIVPKKPKWARKCSKEGKTLIG